MKRVSLLLLINLFVYTLTFAQGENTTHQWYFGENAGIDFSTGIPIAKTDGQITGWEGCATVGDIYGNLLFYTDGQEVYNKSHEVMQNGSGLMGSWSANQSSIIVPYPGNDSLFYIFTVDAIDNHLQNGLRYSIVNMNLDGGLGAITSIKNILLETPVTEKVFSIMHSNNINAWVIAHRWDSDEFVAYSITPSGINTTPIVSAIGAVHEGGDSGNSYLNGWTNAIGQIKANIEGTKIATTLYKLNIVELFDFDNNTGVLSNCYTSDEVYNYNYGLEFSPNSDFLYVTNVEFSPIHSKLYQFDISQINPFENPVLISSGEYGSYAGMAGLQLAPNGKIYVVDDHNPYLGVINEPDKLGLNCDYQEQGLNLDGKIAIRGLPNLFYYKGFEFFTGSELDTTICEGDSIYLENTYQTIAGTYYDTTLTNQGWDSIINIHLAVLPVAANPIITEDSGVLSSSSTTSNQWFFNGVLITDATNQQYQPFVSGTYQVVVENNNGCLSFSDSYSFNLEVVNEMDTTICEGDSIYLENAYQTIAGSYYDTLQTNQGGDSIINIHLAVLPVAATPIITEDSGVLSSSSSTSNQWYFNGVLITGATNQQYQPFVSGTYQVVVENNNACLSFSDEYNYVYVSIKEHSRNTRIFPNPFSDFIFINNDDLFSIEVYDLKGTKLFSKEKLKGLNKIDLMHLDKGFYILKVKTRNNIIIRKIANK